MTELMVYYICVMFGVVGGFWAFAFMVWCMVKY
jgi:hypothetical protein